MGRKRKKANQKLPKGVYFAKGRYIYRPYLGNSKLGAEVFLASGDAPLSKLYEAYARLLERKTTRIKLTLGELIDQFLVSDYFKELAEDTQKSYKRWGKQIKDVKLKNGMCWSSVDAQKVTKPVIRKYLDEKKKKAPVMSNRHLSFLQSVYKWGRQYHEWIKKNPCDDMTRANETSRTREIKAWEYQLVYSLAKNECCASQAYIPILMELCYLCRARRIDIRRWKVSQIHDEGFHTIRGKGSDEELTGWTPRFRKAIQATLDFNAHVDSDYLVHDTLGNPIKEEAFNSAWGRLMKKALQYGLKERFTYHDINSLGSDDHPKQETGRKTPRIQKVYLRRLKFVVATR